MKVTLFEKSKVIKAKKTKIVNLAQGEAKFDENFSILFPHFYMDQVSEKQLIFRSHDHNKQLIL